MSDNEDYWQAKMYGISNNPNSESSKMGAFHHAQDLSRAEETANHSYWGDGDKEYPILEKALPKIGSVLSGIFVTAGILFNGTFISVFVYSGYEKIRYAIWPIYEAVATTINNLDLLAAGAISGLIGYKATTFIAEMTDREDFIDSARGILTAYSAAALLATSAVYVTGDELRQYGYKFNLPQFTQTGAHLSGWHT
jgi:cation transport ATPase